MDRGDGRGIIGQMRVAAIEMGVVEEVGLTIFLWIFVEYGLKMIFSEEKKIRENRIGERKKRERGGEETTETEKEEKRAESQSAANETRFDSIMGSFIIDPENH